MRNLPVVLLVLLSTIWPPVPELPPPRPTSRVFPPAIPGVSPSGARISYVLAGIAPEAPCREAFQPAAVPPGCRTTLRATYADSTQTFVVTVGVAVLDGPRTGPRERRDTGRPATVRPVPFPGGPAERFGQRQYVTGAVAACPRGCMVATAAGYADGRTYQPGDQILPRLRFAARHLAAALHRTLSA
ncbi:hypothetical protein [Nonomuraea maritima]|uniref:hypothetical protein n=1 Tax=Nonomuraea maritima TaxID=683260 RepID=UPI00115FC883|nr:hypothetical protein [Nonomuraea maritima]